MGLGLQTSPFSSVYLCAIPSASCLHLWLAVPTLPDETSLVGWNSSMPFRDTPVPSFLQLHVTPGPISQCLSPELLLMHTGHC